MRGDTILYRTVTYNRMLYYCVASYEQVEYMKANSTKPQLGSCLLAYMLECLYEYPDVRMLACLHVCMLA